MYWFTPPIPGVFRYSSEGETWGPSPFPTSRVWQWLPFFAWLFPVTYYKSKEVFIFSWLQNLYLNRGSSRHTPSTPPASDLTLAGGKIMSFRVPFVCWWGICEWMYHHSTNISPNPYLPTPDQIFRIYIVFLILSKSTSVSSQQQHQKHLVGVLPGALFGWEMFFFS